MVFIYSFAFAFVMYLESPALGQLKHDPDGFDEDSIKLMANAYGDKRTIAQIRLDNALIRAAANGDVQGIRKALKAGAGINSYYVDGYAAFGSDGSGYTALLVAIRQGKVEVVKLLIEAKADLNLKCINPRYAGETALYRAVERKREPIVDLLVKAGAKGNPKQVRLGIEMRRAACRGFKLKEGQGYPNYPGNAGGDGSLEIAEVLKRGANINAPDPAGYTPLMYAANLGLVENVKILLAQGADATLKTYASVTSKGGVTALSLAMTDSSCARAERRKVVELLKARLATKETGNAATMDASGLNELRGSWRVTHAPPYAPTRLAFNGEKIIIFTTDSVYAERRVKVDPKAKPAQIDVLEGQSKAHGIYEISGNKLRICLANWNSNRPSEFKIAKGIVLLTLTRESEQGGGGKNDAPKPLPSEVVKAWRDAGADVGWMKDAPPRPPSTYDFWDPWRKKAKAGAMPAFRFPNGITRRLAKLPDPGMAFGLDFHCGFGNAVKVKDLAGLKSLQSLNLGANLLLKDGDLKDLAALKNLRGLYLFYTHVTDAGLKKLAGLMNLQTLDLSNTRVTDAGLKELAGLKSLRWLNLRGTKVTGASVAALQKVLTACKIVADRDQAK
jgi:uncharacterized protein (TIGR03067 family)